MAENKEFDEAIRKVETKFRVETYLMKLGASEEAAKLIASSPEQIAKFTYDGVDLRRRGSDLPISDDANAKAYFLGGPFKALFAKAPAADNKNDAPQIDPALLASAKAGNRTAYSRLARDTFNGDIAALDAALADKGNADPADKSNGHDKSSSLNGYEGSKNPFYKLRPNGPQGPVDKAVEKHIGELIDIMGHRKVADIARNAKSEAAPLGLSLTGIPLRPGS